MVDLRFGDSAEIQASDVETEGAENVRIKWLLSEKEGTPNFQMRIFELGPGGHTPYHAHDWEHEVYILRGKGKLVFEGEDRPFSAGFFMLVPGGAEHSFVNTGSGVLAFLCMIPNTRRRPR